MMGRVTDPEPRRSERRRRLRWMSALAWLAIVAALVVLWFGMRGPEREASSYSEFKARVAAGEILEVRISDDAIEGLREADDPESEPVAFRTTRVEDPKLVEELQAAGVEIEGTADSSLLQSLLFLLPWLVVPLFLGWILLRGAASASKAGMAFGKSPAKLLQRTPTGVNFDDVAGCDEAKAELREVVEFLKTPKRFEALGARVPKGVLLVGPPGTGKTLLARAVAGEAGVPFYSLSGSDFVEMFVGVGAARVRDLFDQAKRSAPCIVFIDELDAIGRRRGVHLGVVNDEREQTLNQLLVELDGFEPNSGVILLSATNRPDVLDPALLRPGRFDRQVVLDAPDFDGRRAILSVHAHGKPMAEGVDLARIAKVTPGFSGADLANAINEAALGAARRKGETITQADLEEAVEKVIAGPQRKSRRLSPDQKHRVAVHEVGHALVGHFGDAGDPIEKISIVPRGRAALGYTLQVPDDERLLVTERELVGRLRSLLAGRAAEERVLGEPSSGAEDDLARATALARSMVGLLGMGKTTGLARSVHTGEEILSPREIPMVQRDCSEATAHAIDVEVERMLAEAYAGATDILDAHRPELDRLVAALLEREVLDRAGFLALLDPTGDRPPDDDRVARRPAADLPVQADL
jgi:cell division protease FtsH